MEEELSHTDAETVIQFYSNMVYRLAFSQTKNQSDADDVFQEVFMRYIKKMPQFESENHRKAWLIRVTINCAQKLWAAPWRKKTVPLDENMIFERKEDSDLYEDLQKLPMKYRAVIHLFYYEDLSIQEISTVLRRKPSTVRTQLTRARNQLREQFKEDYDV